MQMRLGGRSVGKTLLILVGFSALLVGFAAVSLKDRRGADPMQGDMPECRRLAMLCDDAALFSLSLPFLFLSIDKSPLIIFSSMHELWHLQTVYYTLGQKTKNSHLSRSLIYYIYGAISINRSHPFCSQKSQNIKNTTSVINSGSLNQTEIIILLNNTLFCLCHVMQFNTPTFEENHWVISLTFYSA